MGTNVNKHTIYTSSSPPPPLLLVLLLQSSSSSDRVPSTYCSSSDPSMLNRITLTVPPGVICPTISTLPDVAAMVAFDDFRRRFFAVLLFVLLFLPLLRCALSTFLRKP